MTKAKESKTEQNREESSKKKRGERESSLSLPHSYSSICILLITHNITHIHKERERR